MVAKNLLLLGSTPKDVSEFGRLNPQDFSNKISSHLVESQVMLSELYSRWVIAESQVEEFTKAEAYSKDNPSKELKIIGLGRLLHESQEEKKKSSALLLELRDNLKKEKKLCEKFKDDVKKATEKHQVETKKLIGKHQEELKIQSSLLQSLQSGFEHMHFHFRFYLYILCIFIYIQFSLFREFYFEKV
jgi:membrane-associated HD superfamily phosphohydrolase